MLSKCLLKITKTYFQNNSIALLIVNNNHTNKLEKCSYPRFSEEVDKGNNQAMDLDSVSDIFDGFFESVERRMKERSHNDSYYFENSSDEIDTDENHSNIAQEQFDPKREDEPILKNITKWNLNHYLQKRETIFYIDQTQLQDCYGANALSKIGTIVPAEIIIILDQTDWNVVLYDCYCPEIPKGHWKLNGRGVLVMNGLNTTFHKIENLLSNMFRWHLFVHINVY